MQVAAATECKWCYGVEKADVPAAYAKVTIDPARSGDEHLRGQVMACSLRAQLV